MAATLGGAIKAYLEGPTVWRGASLGISVTSDSAADTSTEPYVVLHGSLHLALDGSEDGKVATGTEMIQADLWDLLDSEVVTLPDALVELLHGWSTFYGTPAKRVYGLLVRGVVRIVSLAESADGPKVSTVHTAITIDVKREIRQIALP